MASWAAPKWAQLRDRGTPRITKTGKGTREAHQARVARSYVCARASTGAHQPLRHQPRASRAPWSHPGTQSRKAHSSTSDTAGQSASTVQF